MNAFVIFCIGFISLLGIWFCYLAFEAVRWLAWTLLFHIGPIAAILASVGVMLVLRRLGK